MFTRDLTIFLIATLIHSDKNDKDLQRAGNQFMM